MVGRTIVAGLLAIGFGHAAKADPAKVLFIAGSPSHDAGQHEHRAGCMVLAQSLEEGLPDVEAEVSWYGWPEDESVFEGVAAIVMYCDGSDHHYVNAKLDFVQALIDNGVGLVCIHYATEVNKGPVADKFKDWIGGHFETNWSVNPHWDATFESLPDHPITRGVEPFTINDEWYYHMRFREGMENVTPILTALPPESTLSRDDGPRSGNPVVREAVAAGEPQHVAWAYERPDGGRGFGFTGGHFHRNWKDDNFRKIVLNAIAWTAHVEVPAAGVQSTTPTDEAMAAHLDEKE